MTQRFCRSALLIAALFGLAGCQQTTDPTQYKPYEELTGPREEAPDANGEEPNQTEPIVTTTDDQPPVESPAIEDTWAIPVSALAPVNVVDGTSLSAVLQVLPPKATPGGGEAVGPRKIELLVTQRDFTTEGPEGALRVSFDDLDLLKVLNMEPVPEDAVRHFPGWLKGLDGQRIRLRGFMYPTFESTGITQFVLARDNQICCFGRNPKVYDLVSIDMRPGKTTDYIQNRPFDVVGTFRIDLLAEGGKPLGLYWIEDAVVISK
jgi:hypothetical protein